MTNEQALERPSGNAEGLIRAGHSYLAVYVSWVTTCLTVAVAGNPPLYINAGMYDDPSLIQRLVILFPFYAVYLVGVWLVLVLPFVLLDATHRLLSRYRSAPLVWFVLGVAVFTLSPLPMFERQDRWSMLWIPGATGLLCGTIYLALRRIRIEPMTCFIVPFPIHILLVWSVNELHEFGALG